MVGGADLDPVLVKLGPRGRFQMGQMMLVAIGMVCAQHQLLDIIFIGKDIPFQCAPLTTNTTSVTAHNDVMWNSSDHVRYEECSIIVTTNVTDGGDVSEKTYDCMHGYDYELGKDASVVSEFDLVCERYVFLSLSQTLVVLGQGIGAFVASVISDRFGRKRMLVGSQLGLLVLGMGIGAAPSYTVFAVFKCLIGAFQQGVVTVIATLGIELFPRQYRSLCALIINMWWAVGSCMLALFAFCLRHHSWRVLQYALSSISLLVLLLQAFFTEESLCWLMANGKNAAVLRVLKRAARANKKDLDLVLSAVRDWSTQDKQLLDDLNSDNNPHDADGPMAEVAATDQQKMGNSECVKGEISLEATRHMTVLDIFRHKILCINALITFFTWFTVAFVLFTLYLMSTSYTGDPYLNYFLTALMEFPPAFILYFCVDRLGRKRTVQSLFVVAGIGCIASAVCLMFKDNAIVSRLPAVLALIGVIGGSGAFGGLFFYTPEYFPTNLRNQALGTGSTVGRVGGMIAPFMKNLALLVVWGPGLIAGSLSLIVVIGVHFLPETKGKELPNNTEDIEKWYLENSPRKRKKYKDGQC